MTISLNSSASANKHSLFGNLIILLAMLPEASYYILSKLSPNRMPVFLVSALLNAINALISLPFLLWFTHWQAVELTPFHGLILVIMSLSTALFFTFWYSVSNKVDGMMASLSTATMPVATVIIACLALGEHIGLAQLMGMSLIISSIFAYALPQKNKALPVYSSQE